MAKCFAVEKTGVPKNKTKRVGTLIDLLANTITSGVRSTESEAERYLSSTVGSYDDWSQAAHRSI